MIKTYMHFYLSFKKFVWIVLNILTVWDLHPQLLFFKKKKRQGERQQKKEACSILHQKLSIIAKALLERWEGKHTITPLICKQFPWF